MKNLLIPAKPPLKDVVKKQWDTLSNMFDLIEPTNLSHYRDNEHGIVVHFTDSGSI
ncbi:hypothetical protein [Lysinibacillus sp. Y5S-8]|uniref:hypothetical protein n=1 Tax=Lysinibacillus sp. Y5S-8 TaxID=3122488 RepID=UPI0030D58D6A